MKADFTMVNILPDLIKAANGGKVRGSMGIILGYEGKEVVNKRAGK